MRLSLPEEKIFLLVSALLALFVFFIPISASIKSIVLVPILTLLLFIPYYRRYLFYSFNTLWSRAALALFLYVVIACIWSEAPFAMRFNTIDKYSKLLFLPIFAVAFVRSQTRKWVLNSYVLVMLLTCILSLLKAKQLLVLNSVDPGEVFYNHIVTGFMIALGVYFSGMLTFNTDTTRAECFLYFFMLILGSYQIIFINTSRTGYIAYIILMSLLILQKYHFKKAVIGLMVFLGAMMLAYALSPVLKNETNIMIQDIKLWRHNQANTSLGYRLQFHQYAQKLFKERPVIGIGTGGFPYRYSIDLPFPSWGAKLNEPHGQYWLTLAEQGLIGLMLLIFFLMTLFITAFQLKEKKLMLLGMLVSFCILSFSDTIFCYSPIGYLLILFTALCFGELVAQSYPKEVIEMP